jgi:hypothetical protein
MDQRQRVPEVVTKSSCCCFFASQGLLLAIVEFRSVKWSWLRARPGSKGCHLPTPNLTAILLRGSFQMRSGTFKFPLSHC